MRRSPVVAHLPTTVSRVVNRIGRRYFGGVSERMLAIILLATLPMATLSCVTAWQNYDVVRAHSSQRPRDIRDHIVARARIQTAVAANILTRLGNGAEEPGSCAQLLHLTVSLELFNRTRLSILDADHRPVCSAASPGMGPGVPVSGLPTLAPGQVLVVPSPAPLLTIDVLSRPEGLNSRVALLMAQFEIGWTRAAPRLQQTGDDDLGDVREWLRFADGTLRPLCADCGWAQPAASMWPATPGAQKAGGFDSLNFAAGPIGNGVDVLVATPPGAGESRALSAFFLRVIEIALILGAALLLVVVAANLAIVAPIDELTRAVGRWRAGGVFQRGRVALMPIELRRLWEAFAAATDKLSEHEARLAASEVKQGLLIKEIHHRVKNNLQIIASLLNLQANRIKAPDSKAEFASARDRVRALATLHRHLYQEGEPESMHLRAFLEELCAQLFSAMGERAGGRIRLEIAVPDIELPADQAVPIALIVTETVSNAVKYAFPGGRSGRVAVRLEEQDPQTLRLVIQDDGIGIPDGRAETESGVRDGLGIQLIRGFARQLGASLDVVQDNGTTYTLVIPRHDGSRGVRL